LIYFPPGTEMVHFPGLTRTRLCIQRAVTWFYQDRFPYSEIPGSKPACGSPRLIAACHVLLRLLVPRHPPYALSSLTIKLTQHVSIPCEIETLKTVQTKGLAAIRGCTSGVTRFSELLSKPRNSRAEPMRGKFAFPHCATLEQKFAVYYVMRT
jgi:hypothetical protein